MPLPAGFTLSLQAFTAPAFWNVESKVNGIWNTMFAFNINQNLAVNSFMLLPEAVQGGVARLRSDTTIARITGATGLVTTHTLLEGKTGDGDSFSRIYGQLLRYFENSDSDDDVWTIGARGSEFKIWFWEGNLQGLLPIELSPAGAVSKYVGMGDYGPTYDLTTIAQPQLQGFLNNLVVFPIPVPP